MKIGQTDLLQRAIGDLWNVNLILGVSTDDVHIDIAAYHCAQCIEKTVKYVIALEGETASPSQVVQEYIIDLKNKTLRDKVLDVEQSLDRWNNQIRYSANIMSSKASVQAMSLKCQEIIEIAQHLIPQSESRTMINSRCIGGELQPSHIDWGDTLIR